MGPVFVEKWSKDQGCLILQSQMFKVWWDDGGHHELLYQVQDQAGNREDCYEKGRGPGRQLQSGWVLSSDGQIFKIQVSELEKSANCANMRGAEVCKSLVHCLAKYNNAMYKVFFWCMFHPLNELHQAGLPDLLSHHHTLRTRVRLALVRHAGGTLRQYDRRSKHVS